MNVNAFGCRFATKREFLIKVKAKGESKLWLQRGGDWQTAGELPKGGTSSQFCHISAECAKLHFHHMHFACSIVSFLITPPENVAQTHRTQHTAQHRATMSATQFVAYQQQQQQKQKIKIVSYIFICFFYLKKREQKLRSHRRADWMRLRRAAAEREKGKAAAEW